MSSYTTGKSMDSTKYNRKEWKDLPDIPVDHLDYAYIDDCKYVGHLFSCPVVFFQCTCVRACDCLFVRSFIFLDVPQIGRFSDIRSTFTVFSVSLFTCALVVVMGTLVCDTYSSLFSSPCCSYVK